MPLLIVVFLWFIVWDRTHQLDPYKPIASDEPPLEVQAVALDWQWLFIYPEENVATLNKLVFPAGRPLSIALTSDTVMNSFFIPALGGQIYAMAGMRTELNLMADAPGSFMGRNTQFSGDGFSGQSFTATATNADGFARFLAEARASATPLDTGTFETVAQPTQNAPEKLFSSVEPNLFTTIIQSHGSMPLDPAAPGAEMPATAEHTGH
jgi:cytochrome o ubiquinol oxidase subunit II